MKQLHELSRTELLDWAVAEMKQTRRGCDEPTEEEIQALRRWVANAADDFAACLDSACSVSAWALLTLVWDGHMILDWDRNKGDAIFRGFGNVEYDSLDRAPYAH